MGVKNLFQFIRKRSPIVFKETNLSELSGKTILVDLSCLLYRFSANNSYYNNKFNVIKSISDINGIKYSHLIGLKNFIKNFNNYENELIFVIDGPATELKDMEVLLIEK